MLQRSSSQAKPYDPEKWAKSVAAGKTAMAKTRRAHQNDVTCPPPATSVTDSADRHNSADGHAAPPEAAAHPTGGPTRAAKARPSPRAAGPLSAHDAQLPDSTAGERDNA